MKLKKKQTKVDEEFENSKKEYEKKSIEFEEKKEKFSFELKKFDELESNQSIYELVSFFKNLKINFISCEEYLSCVSTGEIKLENNGIYSLGSDEYEEKKSFGGFSMNENKKEESKTTEGFSFGESTSNKDEKKEETIFGAITASFDFGVTKADDNVFKFAATSTTTEIPKDKIVAAPSTSTLVVYQEENLFVPQQTKQTGRRIIVGERRKKIKRYIF